MRTASSPAFVKMLTDRAVSCEYKPVVMLDGQDIVGFEAVPHGPAGSKWSSPDALVDSAIATDRVAEFNWVSRAVASQDALDADLDPDMLLFVATAPTTSTEACPADLDKTVRMATERFQVMATLTERAVATDPVQALVQVDRLRAQSDRLGISDIGADAASQAMLSLLRPDVIELGPSIIHGPHVPTSAAVIDAVQAEALRTGATILARGIETAGDLAFAKSIGATLGIGLMLGGSVELPHRTKPQPAVLRRSSELPAATGTPFEAVEALSHTGQHVSIDTMVMLSHAMEDQSFEAAEPTVLLSAFQHERNFDVATQRRYARLARHTVLTACFAYGLPATPAPNIRGYALDPDDPLVDEWAVIVIGSRTAEGLFAREVPTDGKRRFEVITSNDRDLVVAAARTLVRRLDAPPPSDHRRPLSPES